MGFWAPQGPSYFGGGGAHGLATRGWLAATDGGQKFAPPNQQSREECIAFVKDEWGAGGKKQIKLV